MEDDFCELRRLVADGLSVSEIAAALGVAPVTVRRRLERAGLRTLATPEAREARAVRTRRAPTVWRTCRHHGRAPFHADARGVLRCRRCRAEAVTRRRAKVRDVLIAEAGGACRLCGYDRHAGALQFHHRFPAEKSFTIRNGTTRAIDELRAEAAKCVLVCANCHAEIEAGVAHIDPRP
ncbi:MAG: helix-turn-helix domain-containing protein [Solirubrobacteraceae bacterium]|nr:helix-turn-helix domain-containing protein [Solirubrobacteraceae bacterium]